MKDRGQIAQPPCEMLFISWGDKGTGRSNHHPCSAPITGSTGDHSVRPFNARVCSPESGSPSVIVLPFEDSMA